MQPWQSNKGMNKMKKIISISILLLLINVSAGQNNWAKIYDSPFYGITNFYSENINISNHKVVYLMLGLNYTNPNESGRILRLNKNNGNWVIPSYGFLSPYWCFGAIPPNPPVYRCNIVKQFRVSPIDTQFIMKNSEIYCGGYESGNSFFVTYNSGADTSFIPGFSNDFLGQLCTGFDINPVNDAIIYVLYPTIGYYTPKPVKVHKSTNRGLSWFITDSTSVQVTQYSFVKINPLKPNYIYAYGYGIGMSTNSGYDFFEMNAPELRGIYFDMTDSTVYGLGIVDSAIYKSTNHGLNWSLLYKFNERPSAFEISPDNHNILYTGSPKGLYRSINKGLSWSLYNNSFFPSKNVIGISKDPGTGETLYVSTADAVYKVWGEKIINIDTNSFKWLPLSTGNVWVYKHYTNTPPSSNFEYRGKVKYEVKGDTLMPNGKRYLNKPYLGYIRIDSLTTSIYQYDPYNPAGEIKRDSLAARLHDTVIFCYWIADTTAKTVIGESRRNKFNETFCAITNQTLKWNTTYGLGYWTYGNFTDGTIEGFLDTLAGAVINGIVYGDTSMAYSISGQVLYSDNNQPVTAGYVKALKYDWVLDKIITVDSARISSSGYYSLSRCTQDSLDIMAYADDEFQDFAPAYFDTTIYWQNAITLYPTGNINNINIKVRRIAHFDNSSNFVSGGVYSVLLIPNDALKDAMVYAKYNDRFVSYNSSIANGYYIVDSLPAGKCDIIVDRIGYYSDYRSLLIGEYVLDTINFFLTRVTGLTKNISSLPTSFMLFQNYPNPFNPLTTIQFNIPPMYNNPPAHPGGKGVFTKLVVYDILGKEVAVLVNEQLKPGTYEVEWDGTNYSSGLYFYKLVTNEYSETKKMILIK